MNDTRPCGHINHLVVLPLLEVRRDGSEAQVGQVLVCVWSGWLEGRHNHCYALHRVAKSEGWAEAAGRGLTPEAVKDAIHKRPPSTWLSSGYHLTVRAGEWVNFRAVGSKPTGTFAELCPLAQRILEFRPRYGALNEDHPELDLAPADQGSAAHPAGAADWNDAQEFT